MKKSLLLMAGFAAAFVAQGQQLAEGYITWPESNQLHTYIKAWNGGNGTITVNGQTWEDENFFVSRVKPRQRFYNNASQVYESITQYDAATNPNGNDKRMLYWVPIGDELRNNIKTNALPDGTFDGDAFTMWNYLDHYGNWTSPHGWVPGNMADVAHKNGVAVSGVASVPWGSIPYEWRTCLTGVGDLDHDAVGKFLYYHGVDGLGYNSEWGGYAPTTTIALHDALATYMANRNPLWENVWYGGTTDQGNIQFDTGVCPTGNNTAIFRNASIFLNYGYPSDRFASESVAYAKSAGRNPYYIYAGHNMQGGQPSNNLNFLKNYQYSVGLWGAHSNNMFWAARSSKGSSPAVKQLTYLHQNEQWFSNGPRNPAIKKPVQNMSSFVPNDNFCGFSALMSARSTLNWAIAQEPFYTYFNLGNGLFFNYQGKRASNKEWYNIGIQDFLPTWRYWFAPTFMQKTVEEGSVSLSADATWDDAYFGGSCLKITGSADEEYLHLFKTKFDVEYDQVITVRYKLLDGEADLDLVMSTSDNPTEIVPDGDGELSIFTVENSENVADDTFNEGWQTATFVFGKNLYPETYQDENGIGVIGLRFKNARNLNLLIGELSITASEPTATPAAPEITRVRILSNNYAGVDAKIIWNMANNKPAGDPVYNSDVNTSMFRMWAQQEGCEAQMVGATTSWAGLVFSAPNETASPQRMRFGVSALAADLKTESPIAWSEYMDLGEYTMNENITIDKGVIKPNEQFTLSFVDSKHPEATWTLYNATTNAQVWSGSGHTVVCSGLEETGAYNLDVTCNGTTRQFPRYIAISSEGVGALPEIYSLSIDGSDAEAINEVSIKVNESKTFSYTGRKADGSASRGVELQEGVFGVNVGEFGDKLTNKSFSVAAWLKLTSLPEGKSNFLTITDLHEGWPNNYWGYFWSRITGEGKFNAKFIEGSWTLNLTGGSSGARLFYAFDDAKIDLNAWTHVVAVFEYNESSMVRMALYLNGKKQFISAWAKYDKSAAQGVLGGDYGDWDEIDRLADLAGNDGGKNVEEGNFVSTTGAITANDWIAFGGQGQARNITAIDGTIDDFQIWGKAMTQDDVNASMAGLDGNNLPADVLGFWDLESDVQSDNSFIGKTGANATNKTPKAYWYKVDSENSEHRDMSNPPVLGSGCPFIAGTAFPIVTKPTWSTRRANVEGDGNGEAGQAKISWIKPGDFTVDLKLENGHGAAVKSYPVIKVGDSSGIVDIDSDKAAGVDAYTESDVLFVEFDADGRYTVDVYNTSGMLVAQKHVQIAAGQNAQINLGAAGVYLVKVSRDAQVLRTIKVVRK